MKYLRFISIMALLTIFVSVFGKTECKKAMVKYNGETYIVKTTELSNTITNKRYEMPKGTATALVVLRSDEEEWRLDEVAAKIKDIMYSVFPEELWTTLRKGLLLTFLFLTLRQVTILVAISISTID